MRARSLIECSLVPLVLLSYPLTAHAQVGRQFYEDRCAACHSIGGEPAAGPDLKDIAQRRDREWLLRFIRDPEEAAKHDRDAAALVKEFDNGMPETDGATRIELEAVLDYLAAQSANPLPQAPGAPGAAPQATETSAADPGRGRDLYVGRQVLANGAPACVSCHRLGDVAGGALGPDLTGVHRRLGGSRALTTWLANPPTNVMRAVYRPAPLTADEANVLVAFLEDAAAQTAAPSRVPAVVASGVAGAGVALLAFGLTWSRRFRGVRRRMLARANGGGR